MKTNMLNLSSSLNASAYLLTHPRIFTSPDYCFVSLHRSLSRASRAEKWGAQGREEGKMEGPSRGT